MGILSSLAEGIKKVFYIAKEKMEKGIVAIKNALTKFFEAALSFLRTVMKKLVARIRGVILGAAHFFRKVGNKYQEGSKNYSLDQELGDWNETTVTRNISVDDLPPKYRTMEEEFEVDDTVELDNAVAC